MRYYIKTAVLLAICAAWRPLPAGALGPHELALIVNRADPASLYIGNVYAEARSIPPENMVELELPERMLSGGACTPEDFKTHILEPVRAALRERKLDGHILAWAFSAGFPFRVSGNPPLSLTGAVFVGGEHPGAKIVKEGRYASPIFQGPVRPGGDRGRPQSLDHFSVKLQASDTVPAMALAHTGARGLSEEEAVETLERAVRSDYTRPPGNVIFVETENVRSKTRAWQFSQAVEELEYYGVPARVQPSSATEGEALAGVCEGTADVAVRRLGVLVPGAIAEHLTSFGAAFDKAAQMKITDWFRIGASGSAGTVAEPLAIWTKFPHARTFAHYAAGCTMLESFYLGIACPLQILPVGDPLAKPWAAPVRVDLLCLEDGAVSGPAVFALKAWDQLSERAPTALFLDGRPIERFSSETLYHLNSTEWSDGYHRLRAVSRAAGPVAHQGFSEIGFEVDNRGYRVTLAREGDGDEIDAAHWAFFRADVKGSAKKVELVRGERVLAEARPGELLTFDPGRTGRGPITLQARAHYDGHAAPVYSRPVRFKVGDFNRAPEIADLAVRRGADTVTVTGRATDAEDDPLTMVWFERIAEAIDLRAAPEDESAKEHLPVRAPKGAWTLTADVRIESDFLSYKVWRRGGLAIRPENGSDSLTFGFDGGRSCWSLQAGPPEGERTLFSRTARLDHNRAYRLEARADAGGVVSFYVDGRRMAEANLPDSERPLLGVCAHRGPVTFHQLRISPPIAPGAEAEAGTLKLSADAAGTFILRADDGYKASWSDPYSP